MNRMTATQKRPVVESRKVMIVNGTGATLEMFESVLEPGPYDVVFVESSDRAYSQIKVLQPHLVILCVRLDDADGLQVLSMLKLDEETSKIPVLSYTTELEDQSLEAPPADRRDHDLFSSSLAQHMN